MNKLTVKEIAHLQIICDLSKKDQAFICPFLERRYYKPNELIVLQGTCGSDLYLLKEGIVSVLVAMPGNAPLEISQLEKGKLFGEVSFFSHTLITATLIARTDCECVILSSDSFTMLKIGFPETAYNIEQATLKQTADKIYSNLQVLSGLFATVPEHFHQRPNHAEDLPNPNATCRDLSLQDIDKALLSNLNFFQRLSNNQTAFLLHRILIKDYDKGYVFQNKKQPLKRIAIIYSGAVMLFLKKEDTLQKSIAVLGTGELFLPAFSRECFRQLNQYVTCEKTILLELDYAYYEQLHKENPAVFYEISHAICNMKTGAVYHGNRQFVRLKTEYHGLMK
ncbi:MAG: cyclic nucleotide-binding domain-containing protein [Legionella longbeachae]|nr:cyclic nucleotide-binding domain-containing protein [Legionella longbeachae]